MRTTWFLVGAALLGSVAGLRAARDVTDYRYDGAGRLVAVVGSVDGAGNGQSYEYDAAGNLVTNIRYGADNRDADYDADTLRDLDELYWFGGLGETAAGDPDGEGLANSNEFALAGNPLLRDTDADGADDRAESIAGTSLTNSADVFRITAAAMQTGTVFRILWPAKPGRTYQVQRTPAIGGTWTPWGAPIASTSVAPREVSVPATSNAFFGIDVRVTSP